MLAKFTSSIGTTITIGDLESQHSVKIFGKVEMALKIVATTIADIVSEENNFLIDIFFIFNTLALLYI